jgi:hypothetical protein
MKKLRYLKSSKTNRMQLLIAFFRKQQCAAYCPITARYKNMKTLTAPTCSPAESSIWDSLKLAIADSSGFKCWQDDHLDVDPTGDDQVAPQLLDVQVRHYLRQTLETLAY